MNVVAFWKIHLHIRSTKSEKRKSQLESLRMQQLALIVMTIIFLSKDLQKLFTLDKKKPFKS